MIIGFGAQSHTFLTLRPTIDCYATSDCHSTAAAGAASKHLLATVVGGHNHALPGVAKDSVEDLT